MWTPSSLHCDTHTFCMDSYKKREVSSWSALEIPEMETISSCYISLSMDRDSKHELFLCFTIARRFLTLKNPRASPELFLKGQKMLQCSVELNTRL